ncbi:serine--tRNA ligase [Algimonas ampicilliniresistens]|uniref:Serine--tRNA ligase n=1 Tax=Algimonas ampicilliniresistens TaxID=1298735 RepID=A0ABQ5V7U6_9PROT|nr:serine--tRNA ligase [Algimonas ampicilliniresistens]GLQ23613.1 serine--tRNA ligase [Algimonas ampicilliniresistens]
MFDLKAIRENPDAFDAGWARRGLDPQTPTILEKDKLIRKVKTMVQEAEAARNKASKQIGAAMGRGDKEEAERLKTEVAGAKNVIAALGVQLESEDTILNDLLASLPNIPADDVPNGASEDENVEIAKWGDPRSFDFDPKAHDDLGEALGMMDFETAAKMSGSRFVILRGALSRLDRALAAMMLDMQTGEGFEETSPPLLVWADPLYGTGQLPKFEEDLYKTTGDHYLIPTAEVSLTNTVRESILDLDTLPHRLTAHTPCFRSEAGSAGRDTKGMIRQHQFNKVELVSIATPDQSDDEHKNMLRCAEAVLQRLELPYRVVELCTGDLGFGARKTYDIDVWLPSQQTYREISSISNCGDFQARRMNARYRAGEKDNRFVHTLNGSGLAVGRTLVAVLENYQNEDGSITVPTALVPYMGGVETIG